MMDLSHKPNRFESWLMNKKSLALEEKFKNRILDRAATQRDTYRDINKIKTNVPILKQYSDAEISYPTLFEAVLLKQSDLEVPRYIKVQRVHKTEYETFNKVRRN